MSKMITTDLTDEQLEFLLYSIASESYGKMVELTHYVDQTALTCEVLWCKELFEQLELKCPEELLSYGWKQPRKYYDDGYFYIYSGKNDLMWHFECPIPEKINI